MQAPRQAARETAGACSCHAPHIPAASTEVLIGHVVRIIMERPEGHPKCAQPTLAGGRSLPGAAEPHRGFPL